MSDQKIAEVMGILAKAVQDESEPLPYLRKAHLLLGKEIDRLFREKQKRTVGVKFGEKPQLR